MWNLYFLWIHEPSLTPPLLLKCLLGYIKPGKWEIMHLCVKSVNFASFCDFSIECLKWSDSVVFFVFYFIISDINYSICICNLLLSLGITVHKTGLKPTLKAPALELFTRGCRFYRELLRPVLNAHIVLCIHYARFSDIHLHNCQTYTQIRIPCTTCYYHKINMVMQYTGYIIEQLWKKSFNSDWSTITPI